MAQRGPLQGGKLPSSRETPTWEPPGPRAHRVNTLYNGAFECHASAFHIDGPGARGTSPFSMRRSGAQMLANACARISSTTGMDGPRGDHLLSLLRCRSAEYGPGRRSVRGWALRTGIRAPPPWTRCNAVVELKRRALGHPFPRLRHPRGHVVSRCGGRSAGLTQYKRMD